MKGILYKDFLVLKKQGVIILGCLLLYGIIALFGGDDSSIFSFAVVFLGTMLPVTALAYDEQAKWDKYALSMPVSRTEMVVSKYLLCLIVFAIAEILNLSVELIQKKGIIDMDAVLVSLAVLSLGILYVSVMLPLLFRFGVEKGRLMILLVVFVPVGIFMLLDWAGVSMPKSDTEITALLKILPVVALAALILSVLVSVAIYQKKEF